MSLGPLPPYPIEVQQELGKIGQILTQNRTYLASVLAIFLYEIVITLPMEYQRIWKGSTLKNWSLLKTLYVMCRYGTLGTVILLFVGWFTSYSDGFCSRLQKSEPWSLSYVFIVCELIISLRVYALYGQDKRVLGLLLTSLALGLGLQIASSYDNVMLGPFPPGAVYFGVFGCFGTKQPGKNWWFVYWLAPLFQSILVISLTLFKTLQYRRQGGSTPLLKMLIRDGIGYFLLVFTVNLVNMVWFISPVVTPAENGPLAFVVTSIACARLVFNMRSPDAFKRDVTTLPSANGGTRTENMASFKRRTGQPPNSGAVVVEMQSSISDQQGSFDDEKMDPNGQYVGIYLEQEKATAVAKET